MKIKVLGTGNGGAINCYNTCFVIENENKYFLVDGGGGNQILSILKNMNIELSEIHDIFLSHIHTDHLLGLIWVVRMITAKIRFGSGYDGNLNIYGGSESMKTLRQLMEMLFPPVRNYIDKRIFFNVVEDKQNFSIIGLNIEMLDLKAKKEQQFGFIINDEICFAGDESLNSELYERVRNHKWLLHEAFCLDKDEEILQAHLKGHGTVSEVGKLASDLNIQNLVLWHTDDSMLKTRKEEYTKEASQFFNGNIYVPNDLEIIEIL